ncbi:hypothetical protein FFLO_01032 [Filobasidium floriforme]|uniref:Uncharacterized protein n=1 Tax=Filobasidium floriforme TaxID=5210 RepID=A0A8K0JVE0_9TREE|nr:uncharacterized protein HD553DRAFT_344072 [Filobasidium floriforme]KAG7571068.1 hypothetical protein FFLO_01032 [Filobasidium floriforme]KAH8081377.1 hypothetical protein HD553DRAFT_344072 [Filobasidium floriforme]
MSILPSHSGFSSGPDPTTAGSRDSRATEWQNSTCDTDIPAPPVRRDMVDLGALASFRGCLFCDNENTTVITGEHTPWVLLWHRQERQWYRPHCREDQKQTDEDFYGYLCSQHGNQETGKIQSRLKSVPCFSIPSKKIRNFDIYFISEGGNTLDDERTPDEMCAISGTQGSSFQTIVDTGSMNISTIGGPSAASDFKSGHGDDEAPASSKAGSASVDGLSHGLAGIMKKLEPIVFAKGPINKHRCSLCDSEGERLQAAKQKARLPKRLNCYELYALPYSVSEMKWKSPYMPENQTSWYPVIRACVTHKQALTDIVFEVRKLEKGFAGFATQHTVLEDLTVHIMDLQAAKRSLLSHRK